VTDSPPTIHTPGVLTATADAPAVLRREREEAPPTFEEVYQQHFDFVWRLVRRFGVTEAHGDDVVQDVFLVVHRQLAGFEGRSSLRTWLYGITRRVVADHRKKQRRRRETDIEAVAERSSDRPGPEDRMEQKQAMAFLNRLLDELPDEQREVFVLAELEQLSAPEIVELTGTKLNTVYSRLRLARRSFERALDEARGRGSHSRGDG